MVLRGEARCKQVVNWPMMILDSAAEAYPASPDHFGRARRRLRVQGAAQYRPAAPRPDLLCPSAPLGTIPIDGGGKGAGGLWALNFGIGGSNGDPNTLYFTDGIGGETHGLFAAIIPAPEPSCLALLGTALALFAVRRTRSRRQA
jgi:hypothetical protein